MGWLEEVVPVHVVNRRVVVTVCVRALLQLVTRLFRSLRPLVLFPNLLAVVKPVEEQLLFFLLSVVSDPSNAESRQQAVFDDVACVDTVKRV